MLDFCDAPYRFFPAKPSMAVMAVCRFCNANFGLPGRNHRIRDLRVTGAGDEVGALASRGARILFVPNHSTHSDPQLMTEVQRQTGVPSCFMAAYDVFLRGRCHAWVMQRAGAFSVDREGSDRRAMAEALAILKAGRFALTIFPEGNVYMMSDRVTPFLEGAAFIALKAQKDLGAARPVHVVPVSMKVTHLTDVRPQVREKLGRLAEKTGETFRPDAEPVGELLRIGRHLLAKNLKQRGIIGRQESLDTPHLPEALKQGAERIVSRLEEKMDLPGREGEDLISRVRKIRAQIHQIRTDPLREAEHRVAAHWADEAILTMRILSYGSPYVAEKPTLDRYAETVEKLSEDLFGKWDLPFADREAIVRIGAPLNLAAWLETMERGGRARQPVSALTGWMESAVQQGIDEINAGNQREGARLF